jgi:hypothetical protein
LISKADKALKKSLADLPFTEDETAKIVKSKCKKTSKKMKSKTLATPRDVKDETIKSVKSEPDELPHLNSSPDLHHKKKEELAMVMPQPWSPGMKNYTK